MKSGVCSISFRSLNIDELIALVVESGLDAIEWGGDVHVPPGATDVAASVRKKTEDAGLEVASYGSYWMVHDPDGNRLPFEPVLESALALGTDTIRIWAGRNPSDAVTSAQRAEIVDAIREALALCEPHHIKLGLEFHANTLSDSNSATQRLLDEVNHPNLYTYWQPVYWLTDPAYRMDGLKQLSERVLNMHVFQWMFRPGAGSWGDSTDRRPLADGQAEWSAFFNVPLPSEMEHYALLEFVRDDDPAQFLKDAVVLKQLLGN